jgi:hypothetical protein
MNTDRHGSKLRDAAHRLVAGKDLEIPAAWSWRATLHRTVRQLTLVDQVGCEYLSVLPRFLGGQKVFALLAAAPRLLAAAKAVQDLGWARGPRAQDDEMEAALKLIDAAIDQAEGKKATEGTESTEKGGGA